MIAQVEKFGKSPLPRLYVSLCKNCKPQTKLVSRLVAMAFLENPNNYDQVNHIDENPLNNHVENLEWCTAKYNHNYGTRNIRHANALKKRVDMFDLNENYIKTFDSLKEAAEYIDGDPSCVTKVCKGKSQHHKYYIFKYA